MRTKRTPDGNDETTCATGDRSSGRTNRSVVAASPSTNTTLVSFMPATPPARRPASRKTAGCHRETRAPSTRSSNNRLQSTNTEPVLS